MTVGGLDPQLQGGKNEPDLVVPYDDRNNLYTLRGVLEILVGDHPVATVMLGGFGKLGVFIDSGSTFSYMPKDKYLQLEKILNKTCIQSGNCSVGRGEDSMCYKLENAGDHLWLEVEKIFPPITININNKYVKWSSRRYMSIREARRSEVCLGVIALDRFILGANWMTGRNIVFDLDNKQVEIYNDVECVEKEAPMSQYTQRLANNPQLDFNKEGKLGWQVRFDSFQFILGVGCLLLACIIGVVLCLAVDSDKKETNIIPS